MIEGSFSLGQYRRSIRMNLPAGAGSQFDSLSAPGGLVERRQPIEQLERTAGPQDLAGVE